MAPLVIAGMSCTRATSLPKANAHQRPAPEVRVGLTTLESPSPPFESKLIDGYPSALVDRRPMLRVLRGDFEAPETLVMAYEEDWLDSITQIVSASEGQARVLLFASEAESHVVRARILKGHHNVDLVTRKLDSPWIRDYGPLQTYDFDAGPVWLDFNYAWDRPLDDQLPGALSELYRARLEVPSLALDGGAVISNGDGLCALTRTSLIDAGFTDPGGPDFEEFLAGLGCKATAVLPPLPLEATGHADVIAQFLTPELVMVAWMDSRESRAGAEVLEQAAENLEAAAELGEYPLQIIRVPIRASGDTYYSYVNATRLRSRLLVPRFNDMPEEIQESAYATLQTALPEVDVVPIDADTMVQLGGAVHCVTLGLGSARARGGGQQRVWTATRPAASTPGHRG